VPLRLAHAIG